ncbi:MAG: AraC family transcriptional regulator [Lachnospiraceae bacterium]
MQYFEYNEKKKRGTTDFPFDFYHIDEQHPQYIMPYHWHIEYEIIRILEGTFTISLDEQEFIAHPGDILFIGDGILHAGMPQDCVYECIVFDMNTFLTHHTICRKLIQNIIDHSILIHHYFPKSNTQIHEIVWHMFDAFSKQPVGYQLSGIGEFYHFFGTVYSNGLYLTNPKQTPQDHKRIMQIKSVMEFIESSYASTITLEELSGIVHMSPKYFCRFFYEMTRQTPISYVNSYRIERACHQLLTTDLSVTEIAFSCGFNDTSYFIKQFKLQKSVTPKQYAK